MPMSGWRGLRSSGSTRTTRLELAFKAFEHTAELEMPDWAARELDGKHRHVGCDAELWCPRVS